MNGLRRTFFAVAAACLRGVAFVPFVCAHVLTTWAAQCEQRAVLLRPINVTEDPRS